MARQLRFTHDLAGYLKYKSQPGVRFSDGTSKKYVPHIRRYLEFAADVPLDDQDATFLEMAYFPASNAAFVDRYGREPSPSWAAGRYDALNSWFDFGGRLGVISHNPLEIVVKPSWDVEEIEWLTDEEDAALAVVEKDPLEDVVVGLLRNGLREAEAAALADDDVDLALGLIRIRDGKTGAAKREVVMLPTLYAKVERWRAFRDERDGPSKPGRRFVRTKSGRISTGYIWRITKIVCGRAGIRLHRDEHGRPTAKDKAGFNTTEVSPHALRRTFGSDLLNRGVRIEVVSEQLGHSSVAITRKAYARLLRRTQRTEVLAAVETGPMADAAAVENLRQLLDDTKTKNTAPTKTRAEKLREVEILEQALAAYKASVVASL